MFKRVMLCYDGTEVGRRALKRGAELAILVGARVYVRCRGHRGCRRPCLYRR
jgi:hypothetical protein